MPVRPYRLDTGFDTNPVLPPERKPEPTQGFTWTGVGDALSIITMPINPSAGMQAIERNRPLLDSAFRMENDVANFIEFAMKPTFKRDPDFKLEDALKEGGLWDDYRWNFLGVESEQEMLYIAGKIKREEDDKARLAAAGPGGFAAMMLAGIISPTVLIPAVGAARTTGAAVRSGLAFGALAGAAQEIPLQLNQETRTMEESLWSIGASTVVGGILGGAVGYLSRPLRDVADDMVMGPRREAIPTSGGAQDLSAAANQPWAGPLKSAIPGRDTGLLIDRISPVTRVLGQQTFQQASYMMSRLADAGTTLARNVEGVATSIGGTAENRIKTYYAPVARGVQLLDDAYARYMLGSQGRQGFIARQRANLAGLASNRTKLSKSEFKAAVARAMRNGDESDIPEAAEVAAFVRKEIYDPIYQRAQEMGIYRALEEGAEASEEVLGDVSYLNRDYNLQAIAARRQEFVQTLQQHYAGKLDEQFQTRLAKFLEREETNAERLEDLQRPLEEVETLRQRYLDELRQLDETRTEQEEALEDLIADMRSMGRDKKLSPEQRKDARDMAKLLEESGGEGLAARKSERKKRQRRLRNLNRSFAMYGQKMRAKLDKVGRNEELALASLNRAVRSAQKVLRNLDTVSDANFEKEIATLRDRFARVAADYDAAEERIGRAIDEDPSVDIYMMDAERAKLGGTAQVDRAERLTRIAEELENVESLDRDSIRMLIQEGLDESLAKVNRMNGRRVVRAERLKEQAEQYNPKLVADEIQRLQGGRATARQEFADDWRTRGADDVDFTPGFRANFDDYAREIAETVTDKITGTNARLAGMDLIMQPRGAEFARILDIDSNLIEDFLENDVEKLVMQYVRTLAPDIEITRALGEYAPDMGRNMEFQKLNEEYQARDAALEEQLQARGAGQVERDKAHQKLAKEFKETKRDLEAVIGRLRHVWGLPQDPAGIGARAGRIAMNINVLRYMNMVTVSSIPDLAQPIIKYGLMRTFRDGWLPFIKQMTKLNFDNRELKLAGAALDLTLHSRAQQVYDIGDYMVRGSKFEKGLEYATSKIGLIAAFDYWTTAMKQVAGSAANAQIIDDLRVVVGGDGSAKAQRKATEHLAAMGIDAPLAQSMWDELMKPGGSDMVNGVLWPNTEAWDNTAGAVDAYRSALVREVERTIITPGVERPLMTDSTLAGRLLFQFKGFALSSTTKTVLAGLQQRDMAVVQGAMVSLALGALSYYIWANITGGQAKAEMEADLAAGNFDRFADEAISRSGLLGIMSSMMDVASTFPMAAPYVTFSGERTSRQAGNDILQAAFGPSYDLASRAATVAGGINEPTMSTVRNARRLLPFQNHFLLRQAFDAIEAAAPVPERRQ